MFGRRKDSPNAGEYDGLWLILFRFRWVCVQPLAVSIDKTSIWNLISVYPTWWSICPTMNEFVPSTWKKLIIVHIFRGVVCMFVSVCLSTILAWFWYISYWPLECSSATQCYTRFVNKHLYVAGFQVEAAPWFEHSSTQVASQRLSVCTLKSSNAAGLEYRAQGMDHGQSCRNRSRRLNVKTGVVLKQRVLRSLWQVCGRKPNSHFFPRVSVKRFCCPNPARAGLGNGACGTRATCDAGSSAVASDGLKLPRNG